MNANIMVKGVWQDDNTYNFAKWFGQNCKIDPSYEVGYTAVKNVFALTGRQVCTLIMQSQPKSYAQYAYIKKYAGQSSIFNVLPAKYRTTTVNNLFTKPVIPDVACINKDKVNTMGTQIEKSMKLITQYAADLSKSVLAFGVGLKGVDVEGMSWSAQARLIARLDLFNNPLRKAINEALDGTNIIASLGKQFRLG